MSIPHLTVFSDALYGPNANAKQSVASQYFTAFRASLHNNALYQIQGKNIFSSVEKYQKALWWYYGAAKRGVLSLPKEWNISDINSTYPDPFAMFIRGTFGYTGWKGQETTSPTGKLSMPTLMVCGEDDKFIFCNEPWALKTEDYIDNKFTYVKSPSPCAHWPMKEGPGECDKDGVQVTVDAVVNHINANKGR